MTFPPNFIYVPGFKHGQRSPKRFKDIAPDTVSSDGEDSDLDLPHSKSLSQQKKAKKAKKADGWIWLQGLTRAQYMNGDKLAAYRSESELF